MKIRALLTFIAALLLTVPLFGQDRAAIRGTITDPSGSLVAGAHVELKSPGTGLTRESVTGGGGDLRIRLSASRVLPVNDYAEWFSPGHGE